MRGAPYDIEHRIYFDGKKRWIREKAEIAFDADRRAVRGIGIAR